MAGQSGLAPKLSVGIDLGTTHTVVARHGEVQRVADAPRPTTLFPSVLAYPPDGSPVVGWRAKDRRIIDPKNTLASTKRLIGAAAGSHRARRFEEHHAYDLLAGDDGRAVIGTRAGSVDPIDAAADFLGASTFAAGIDATTYSAVITVPAAFEGPERTATLEAARRAGFQAARLIEEPVATAIAYLAHSNLRYAVVYDLGGGTFDVAVVDCSEYPLRVLAHGGDAYLGGDDVDRQFAKRAASQVLAEHRWDLTNDRETFARLTAACERSKVLLSELEAVSVELGSVDAAGPWMRQPLTLQRSELAAITRDLVRRTFSTCDQVLGEAGVRANEVDAVFLAGGSTALPGLSDMVSQYFGKRARNDLDPLHVVAEGASLGAARPDLSGLLEAEGYAA